MTSIGGVPQTPDSALGGASTSEPLRRFLAGFASRAVAVLSDEAGPVTICTHGLTQRPDRGMCGWPLTGLDDRGRDKGFRTITLCDAEISALDSGFGDPAQRPRIEWRGYACGIGGGGEDRLALALAPGDDPELAQQALSRIWPALRQECLRDARAGFSQTGEAAALWTILDRIELAFIIVDRRGLMFRVNAAGRQVLDEAQILRRGRGGIFAASDSAADSFRVAVAECAAAPVPALADRTIVLTHRTTGQRHPVTLSRYVHDGVPTGYVVVMVPRPPEAALIERMVAGMGLTPREARVASLMQIGLTNRVAAGRAGVTEQTFNTYAKRVLSKLNVGCRTEMARLLTWQAAGGRMT